MARVILLVDEIPLSGMPDNPEGPLTGGIEFPDELEPFFTVHEVFFTKGTENDPGTGVAKVSIGYYQSTEEVEAIEVELERQEAEAAVAVKPKVKIKPPHLTVVPADGSPDPGTAEVSDETPEA